MKRTKQYEIASFKALPDQDGQKGRFAAIVSVFGNVDLQGDRVKQGAFAKSLEKWRASGDPIPIIWSHDWGDPFAHVGAADPALAEELAPGDPRLPEDLKKRGGLMLVGSMDVHKPFAAQVYDLAKSRRVREWSFAYDIVDEGPGEGGANDLRVLDIIEAGPTLKGANSDTATLGVKTALEHAAKAGRVLSAKNESKLRAAYASIGEVLSALPDATEDEKTKEWLDAELKSWLDAEAAHRKAEGKPWHIEERDGRFCVIKDDDSSTVACHDTREEAEAQVRALYASEAGDDGDGEKHLGDKAVDRTEWDGNAAMTRASGAENPAAAFRAICAGEHGAGEPSERQHWALPHHKNPGDPPNATGVSSALGRFDQTEGLTNKAEARRHLERHRDAIAADDDGKAASEIANFKTQIDALLADV